VVRPERREKTQDFRRWMVGRRFSLGLRSENPDVFPVSNRDETDTGARLEGAVKPTFLIALVWMAAGAWLLVHAIAAWGLSFPCASTEEAGRVLLLRPASSRSEGPGLHETDPTYPADLTYLASTASDTSRSDRP
jgi:hypothetical protein